MLNTVYSRVQPPSAPYLSPQAKLQPVKFYHTGYPVGDLNGTVCAHSSMR